MHRFRDGARSAPAALARPEIGIRPVRVLIVAGHDLVRAGLRSLVAGTDHHDVVDEARDLPAALAAIGRTRPDVALVDADLAGTDGIAATRIIAARALAPHVVLVAPAHDPGRVLEALRAGARGYVLLDVSQSELAAVIDRVVAGDHAIEATLAGRILHDLATRDEAADRGPEPLTAREREILALISLGQTNREIATKLIVAVGTVKVHVEHILDKLGVHDRTQAAVRAVELGLVNPSFDDPDVARPRA